MSKCTRTKHDQMFLNLKRLQKEVREDRITLLNLHVLSAT